VAEEQNFDQQSDAARRVGQAPQDGNAEQALGQAMDEDARTGSVEPGLKKAVERAIPRSD